MKYFILFLCSFCSLHALYVGNPAEPQIIDQGFLISPDAFMGVKIGYQGDRVLNRKLKCNNSNYGTIDTSDFLLNQGVLILNFMDRFEVYGSVGSISADISHRPSFDKKQREYFSREGWTSGVGGRFLLAQWKDIALGLDGKIQWANPAIRWMVLNGTSVNTSARFHYREWQVSIAASYTVDWMTPYIACKYSNVHAQISGIPNFLQLPPQIKMTNRERFGGALGVNLTTGKKIDLFAEAQLFDETSFSFGGNLRF